MTKTKRIHHPVDKKAIAISIDLYNKIDFDKLYDDGHEGWDAYWSSLANICPGNSCQITCSLPSVFQAMLWTNTLTVDRVYALILASGINTEEVQIDD